MLSDDFNNTRYELRKESDYVLSAAISMRAGAIYNTYDFLGRVLYTRTGTNDGGVMAVPFDQLDRESLEFFHKELINLDGKPPALPWTKAKLDKPAPGKSLNL